jgi:lysozyme family protein
MANNFDLFFDKVLADEGTKYEDVPGDNGGPTKCGVTIFDVARFNNIKIPDKLAAVRRCKDYPRLLQLVHGLDPETARPIYKRYYWDDMRCDELLNGLDYAVADFATNSGEAKAAKTLNTLLGLKGSKVTDATIEAIGRYGAPIDLITHFQDARKAFLTAISEPTPAYLHNVRFRKGWLAREARVRVIATGLAGRDGKGTPPPAPKAIVALTSDPTPPSTVRMVKESTTVWAQVAAIGCAIVAKVKGVSLAIGGGIAWLVEQLPDVTKEAGDHVSAVKDAAQLVGATEAVTGLATGLGLVFAGWVIVRHVRDRKKLKTLESTVEATA